ncbi:MAG: hypothetical protein ABIG93_05025 [archaeon]
MSKEDYKEIKLQNNFGHQWYIWKEDQDVEDISAKKEGRQAKILEDKLNFKNGQTVRVMSSYGETGTLTIERLCRNAISVFSISIISLIALSIL